MGKSTTGIEVKAAAMADLAAGEQPAIVADRYNLSADVVRQWKRRMPAQPPRDMYVTRDTEDDVTMDVTNVTPVTAVSRRHPSVEARQIHLADLVARNLEAKLTATQRIAEHVQSEAWLKTQSAADVATLFTAIDRSATSILDRMAAAHAPPEPEQQSGEE